MKKNKRGGKRKGSGRPKKEPTNVRRIPVALNKQVDKLVYDYKESKIATIHPMPNGN